MGLREAVVAEALELLEAPLGIVAAVAAPDAPLDEAGAPSGKQRRRPLVHQRAPKRVRVRLVKPRGRHREPHGLLLKERDAQRLLENGLHLVARGR